MKPTLRIVVACVAVVCLLVVEGVVLAAFSLALEGVEGVSPAAVAKARTAALLGGLVAVALAAGALDVFVRRHLLTPLRALAAYADAVAHGERPPCVSGPFIGRLASLRTSLCTMVDALHDALDKAAALTRDANEHALEADASRRQAQRLIIKDETRRTGMLAAGETLETVADSIATMAKELRHVAAEVSDGAAGQQVEVDRTAEAVSSMTAAFDHAATRARQAADSADAARRQAAQGASVVDLSVDAITSVREQAAALSQNMTHLGHQAESIGAVMTVISDIADQTNLLALNAAIEAARAGDAGRGFAVVADEVRKLAEKTMQATREVGAAIEGIQQGTRTSLSHVEHASSAVEDAASRAAESRTALTEIVSLAQGTASEVQELAIVIEQQAGSSADISKAVTRIHEISARTTDGMLAASRTIAALSRQAEELVTCNGVLQLIGKGEVQAQLERMAAGMQAMDPARMETDMRQAAAKSPYFELLYATDARGVQTTANIGGAGLPHLNDPAAKGRNWSNRPWFAGPLKLQDTYISPVYVSTATNSPCLTISTPIWREDIVVGVLAADIRVTVS
ncbi:methyl-accepting chemotaxis protein [Megalodesulfovibrio gigas]|uniref:Putative methyl-accepting chemotaxis sensory transducer with Cache sensor n=1 Tax=Megalodesulfovibrio gigas (strain ATCC 19364 / DSM 1382 / NCIMB 9332 / VKM B-1759) TaxID=1121448 RepID=T2GCJ1_MEGG1|nr:methyl-accepting chemotaxis protein [Megalodesulfovibrio gigas]AGW14018.1 putative methyl-accepting chemotaxis sensory transducer with Cache sensor [Megalodesulfovibrio gigas DSM 1382 = ATCC 19364]